MKIIRTEIPDVLLIEPVFLEMNAVGLWKALMKGYFMKS